MKDSTKQVFEYLKKMKDKNVTAADVALATGLTKRQVDGIFTAAIQRKGFGDRVPAQVKDADGNYISITHNDGTISTYKHLRKALVNIGDTVDAKEQIGIIGKTGYVIGECLAFSIKDANGNYINPLSYNIQNW